MTTRLAILYVACVLTMTGAREAASQGNRLVVRFAQTATPLILTGGGNAPESYSYQNQSTLNGLQAAGVVTMEPLFPEFTPDSIYTHNAIGEPTVLPDLSTLFILILDESVSSSTAQAAIATLPDVVECALDVPTIPLGIPNDPDFSEQWYLNKFQATCHGSGLWDVDMNAPEAWDIETETQAIRVGVIDTGIEIGHDDFEGRAQYGADFTHFFPELPNDTDGHGTAVAGVIAAGGNNGIGPAGIAWHAIPIALKVNTNLDQARAFDWARTHQVPITNISRGGGGYYPAERDAANAYFLQGNLIVASSGNDGVSAPDYPAGYDKPVYSVGAVAFTGARWTSSNYGPSLDICAAGGVGVSTLALGNTYHNCTSGGYTGTSFSAPQISGLAAALQSLRLNLLGDPLLGEDMEHVINATAEDVTAFPASVGRDDETGFGFARADRAMRYIMGPRSLVHRRAINMNAQLVTTGPRTFYGLPSGGVTDGTYTTDVYRMTKDVSYSAMYVEAPDVWVRRSGTLGVEADQNPFYYWDALYGGSIVPGSQAAMGCEVETYIYAIHKPNGSIVWFPATLGGAAVALTTVGSVFSPSSVPPTTIANLRETPTANGSSSALDLMWSAPYDDNNAIQAAEYDLRYSLSPITAENFAGATRVTTAAPRRGGSLEFAFITGLSGCTQYYFAIKSRGAGGEWSAIGNILDLTTHSCDTVAPAAATIAASVGNPNTTIQLGWTTPGDDGTVGQAAAYDLRVSAAGITAGNFGGATPVTPQPTPGAPGSSAAYVYSPRNPCAGYYFALKTRDEANNWSAISNIAYVASQGSGCEGGGEGGEDPPILHHAGRDGSKGSAFSIRDGFLRLRVLLGPGQSPAQLQVYNVLGRAVKTLSTGETLPGWHDFEWRMDDGNGGKVGPGVYFIALDVAGIRRVDRLILLP